MTNFYWHIHHEVLVEPLTEPIESRIAFIKEYKPEDEVDLRLRLMKPVKGKLPEAVVGDAETFVEAREVFVKAVEAYKKVDEAYNKEGEFYLKERETYIEVGKACNKTWEAYDQAQKAYLKALSDHAEEIEALHAKECPDCPWNGHTIFPSD